MAVRRDKQGCYYVEFQSRGERVLRRCGKGTTKAQAEDYEAELRRAIFRESALGQKPVITIAAAIQEWLNHTLHDKKDQRMPKQNAVHLAEFIRGKTLQEAPDAARKAVLAWQGSLAPATINRRLAVLKAACKWAWKQGWVEQDVSGRIARLREPSGREVYLTAEQVKRLAMAAPNKRGSAAIWIAAYSGLRASELLALPACSAHCPTLTVPTSKNGRPRLVPVASILRPHLRHLPLGVSYRTLAGWFWAARDKAGMPHVHFHDLRHTTASLLANKGVDLYTIGKILGHKTVLTTQRYAHLTDQTAKRAMRKIG